MSFAFSARREGFSLAELLVALALLSLLTTTCLLVVLPSLRITARSSARSGMQQQALMLLTRLERNLLRSSDFGVSLRPATPGQPFLMALQRLQSGQEAFAGSAVWETSLLLYRHSGTTLTEETFAASTAGMPLLASDPLRCTPAQLLGLSQKVPEQRALLTHQAAQFAVTREVTSLLVIDLTLEDATSDPPYRFHLRRALALRAP